MSEEDPGFAPPPFNVAEGLQKLQRELRALGLSERQGSFERRGQVLAQAALKDGRLQVSVAKRPARSPEWQHRELRSSADLRDLLADLKKRLAQWNERDD
jgi:hypothetical protein